MPAGLWIKVAATLPRHYKTEYLSRALSLPVHEVVGKLVTLWIYAVEFANAGLLTLDDIRRGFFATDEPCDEAAVQLVADALCDCGGPGHCGFLERFELPSDGGDEDAGPVMYGIHDWQEYSGVFQPESDLSYKKRKDSKKKRQEKEVEQKPAPPAMSVPARDTGPALDTEQNQKAGHEEKTAPHLQPPIVREPLTMSQGLGYTSIKEQLIAMCARNLPTPPT